MMNCPRPLSVSTAEFQKQRTALAAILMASLGCIVTVGLTGCGGELQGTTGTTKTGTLVVSTQSLDFGAVPVGQTSGTTLSLSNSGSSPIEVEQVGCQGGAFAVAGQNRFPISIAGGKSYSLAVSFHPTTIGTTTGAVVLTDNSSSSNRIIVALSGTGESAASATASLASVICSDGSITGAGTDYCAVALTGPAGSGGFPVGLSSSNPAVVVPAAVTVPASARSAGFTPTVSAVTTAQAAELTATAGGVTEHYTIQLGAASPGLTLQSATVPFGNVALNTPATQTVTLTSSGTAALTISAASVTGAGFSLAGPSLPLTLQPGQTAPLAIQFDPTANGAAIGALTLSTNTSSGPITIALSGTGVTPRSYEVDLNWESPTDSADPVAGYEIYRAVSGSSSYQVLNSNVDHITTYADVTVQSGTSYTYYVESVDGNGNQSAPSNLFTVLIP